MLVSLLLFISFIILLDYLSKYRRYKLTQNIPGPQILPIIGNMKFFSSRIPEDIIEFLSKNVKTNSRKMRLWLGPYLLVATYDPRDLKVILNSQELTARGFLYEAIKPLLGDGLFFSYGEKAHRRRKTFIPWLFDKEINKFFDGPNEHCDILVESLRKFAGKSVFDIYPMISRALLDIFGEINLDINIDSQRNSNERFLEAMEKFVDIAAVRSASVFHQFIIPFAILTPHLFIQSLRSLKVINEFSDRNIKIRKEFRKQKELEKSNGKAPVKERKLFLDTLIETTDWGRHLTDKEIRYELNSTFFASHGATATTFPFVFYRISRHPEVQEKIMKEIWEIYGTDPQIPLNVEKTNQLKYLDLVIKEALRFYPLVPLLARVAMKDIEINGNVYPKGTGIAMPVILLHKDPEFFPDPEEFRPERHIDSHLNDFTYLPFSFGPRGCIGQKVAMLEMKSIIVKILLNFELLPMGPEPKLEFKGLLKSSNGVQLGLRERVFKK